MLARIGLTFIAIIAAFNLWAFEVPKLTGPVVDEAGLISFSAERKIGEALKNFKNQFGPQIQVLTLETLDNTPLEEASIKITDTWKLGSESGDNGVLFLIAKKERQMRIEVGQGLEGMLTDVKSARILDLATPYFAQGDFDLGVSVALNAIMGQLGGENAKTDMVPVASKKQMNKNPRGLIFFVFLFLFLIFGGRGRRRRSWFLYGGGGRSRGGFSGGGWSGGGGGFSGGGASGRW